MSEDLHSLAAAIYAAEEVSDVLGPPDSKRDEVLRHYRLVLHPDKHEAGPDRDLATEAFKRLEYLLAKENKVKSSDFEISSKRHSFAVRGVAYRGNVANLYNAEYLHDGAPTRGLMKVARSPKNNDLLVAEAKTLKVLNDSSSKRTVFVPTLDDSFVFRDKDAKIDRRTNVFRKEWDGWVSLADVRRLFPAGVDPHQVSWIYRRALSALDFVHDRGYVHGGISPEHILILPNERGAMLVGFGSSVEIGETVKVKPSMFVAPEMAAKEPATAATDIYMLSKTMEFMMGAGITKPLKAFLQGTTYERPKVRPQNAGALLEEFDKLLERMWGPRTYRPFDLPATV